MVTVTATLELAETDALDIFDNVTYMGFGSGTTTPNGGQTTLVTEVYRGLLESSTKDSSNDQYTFVGRIPITQFNSGSIEEIGLFDASTGGNMYCRILVPVTITKTSDDEVIITLRVRVNAVNN